MSVQLNTGGVTDALTSKGAIPSLTVSVRRHNQSARRLRLCGKPKIKGVRMSEFTCWKGHSIRPSVGYCEICGGRATRMDGMTNKELEARDRVCESYLIQRELEAEAERDLEL